MDNATVRLSTQCPLCLGAKPQGLIACWPCYHAKGMRYGNPEAEAIIAQANIDLAPPPGWDVYDTSTES
jgi:hypothetical protein